MAWSLTQVSLGTQGQRAPSRLGFVNERGLIAVPPKRIKRFGWWAKRMGISAEAQDAYRQLAA